MLSVARAQERGWLWDVLRIALMGAMAAAVMSASISLRVRTEDEISALAGRVGGDLFYAHAAAENGAGFSLEDIAAAQGLGAVERVAGQGRSTTLVHGSFDYSVTWLPVSLGYETLLGVEFVEGGAFTGEPDEAILGYRTKQEIYGQDSALGDVLFGRRVVGVLEELPLDDTLREHLNRIVLTSSPVHMTGFAQADRAPFTTLIVRPRTSPQAAITALRALFPEALIVLCRDIYAVGLEDGDIALGRLLTGASWVALALSAALISILVALSVLKRLREIGIRRSVGAGRGDVFLEFVGLGAGGASTGGCIGLVAVLGTLCVLHGSAHLAPAHLLVVPWVSFAGLAGGVGPALWAAGVPPLRAVLRKGSSASCRWPDMPSNRTGGGHGDCHRERGDSCECAIVPLAYCGSNVG